MLRDKLKFRKAIKGYCVVQIMPNIGDGREKERLQDFRGVTETEWAGIRDTEVGTEVLGGDLEPCRSLARTATKKTENSVGSGGFEGPVGHSCQESK